MLLKKAISSSKRWKEVALKMGNKRSFKCYLAKALKLGIKCLGEKDIGGKTKKPKVW